MRNRLMFGAALFGAFLAMPAYPVHADEVTDQFDEAAKAYAKKDFSTATAALDVASKLIRQQRAEALTKVLPEPLAGWTADKPETSAMGAAVLGGATTISRKFHRDSDSVDVEVTTDSPMIQGMGAFFNAAFAAGGNGKLIIVDGRKVNFDPSDNSYQSMVAGKTLVKVSGSTNVDEATLKSYFTAIKLDDIEKSDGK